MMNVEDVVGLFNGINLLKESYTNLRRINTLSQKYKLGFIVVLSHCIVYFPKKE